MMHTTRRCLTVLLMVLLLISNASPIIAQNRVRAKIGIEIKSLDHSVLARAEQTIYAGDLLRIYVVPEDDVYIYVVHEDDHNVTLLNGDEYGRVVKKGFVVVYPRYHEHYRIDGQSPKESFTIICSPVILSGIAKLFSFQPVGFYQWLSIKNSLREKSHIDLTDIAEKPLEMAGGVRGSETDTFLSRLKIFSGNGLLLKSYDFQFEK